MGDGGRHDWFEELLAEAQRAYERYIDETLARVEAVRRDFEVTLNKTAVGSLEHDEAGDVLDELDRIAIQLRGEHEIGKQLYERRLGPLSGRRRSGKVVRRPRAR